MGTSPAGTGWPGSPRGAAVRDTTTTPVLRALAEPHMARQPLSPSLATGVTRSNSCRPTSPHSNRSLPRAEQEQRESCCMRVGWQSSRQTYRTGAAGSNPAGETPAPSFPITQHRAAAAAQPLTLINGQRLRVVVLAVRSFDHVLTDGQAGCSQGLLLCPSQRQLLQGKQQHGARCAQTCRAHTLFWVQAATKLKTVLGLISPRLLRLHSAQCRIQAPPEEKQTVVRGRCAKPGQRQHWCYQRDVSALTWERGHGTFGF